MTLACTEKLYNQAMRHLLPLLSLLILLAALYKPASTPPTPWLEGKWHDPKQADTRLSWSPGPGGATFGLLTSPKRIILLRVEANGNLTHRDLALHNTQPARALPCPNDSLGHLNYRTSGDVLILQLGRQSWSLERD